GCFAVVMNHSTGGGSLGAIWIDQCTGKTWVLVRASVARGATAVRWFPITVEANEAVSAWGTTAASPEPVHTAVPCPHGVRAGVGIWAFRKPHCCFSAHEGAQRHLRADLSSVGRASRLEQRRALAEG